MYLPRLCLLFLLVYLARPSCGAVVHRRGVLPLTLQSVDTASGATVTLNSRITLTLDQAGRLLSKSYTGGLLENYTRATDGSLTQVSAGSAAQGVSARITQTPSQCTTAYDGGPTIKEDFYDAGPRSAVDATGDPGDHRTFRYERLALKQESHTAGPWAGWAVEWESDDHGRPSLLRIKQDAAAVREFTLGYDDASRLNLSSTPELQAAYDPRTALGQVTTLSRGLHGGRVVTAWTYDDLGRLSQIANTVGTGSSFAYHYPDYDARHRLLTRRASPGLSWSGLTYDTHSQVGAAALSTGRPVAYGYDARGNRIAQGTEVAQQANALDQVASRTLSVRGFGLLGWVDRKARVAAQTSLTPGWQSVPVDPATGSFYAWWPLPAQYLGGAAARLEALVRGVRPADQPGAPPAIAEQTVSVVVPPTLETLHHDAAGRLVEDAFWIYTWDGAGRLIGMTRKAGTLPAATLQSENLVFGYDADGRRTTKTHTLTYPGNDQKVELSQVLWAGWLPVLEQRSRCHGETIESLGRRWFQWGADLSGSLDGAGGIGGLVAIHEENAAGVVTRTLLPVQDGLGNITAVLDAATGQTVARYDFGPFGEPLSESGQTDACPFRWQSKWYDAESQHYYFGYRHYDPRLGRWLSRDPLGEEGGMNLYAYCGNDPVNRHDPNGMAPITDPIRAAILSEIDQAAALVDSMTFPGTTDALALGRLRHAKFAEIMSNSKYRDFLLVEQSVNEEGGAVNRQHWSDGVKEFFRWPKGSRRPDLMILEDSDYKSEALKGGGYSLKGKIESAVDLKANQNALERQWVKDVSERPE